MVNGNLPDGWEWKTVEDLYDVLGGGTPSTAEPAYWTGNIPWITSADIHGLKDIRPRKSINQDAINNSATTLVPAGSLIVVTRVSLGKVALTSSPICFSQDSQALIAKAKNILPGYALYYLAQAVQSFKYVGRGTTISGVTKKQLKELPFPLPPLPEQERIVSRIDELFSDLEAGVAALERIRAGLRRYKASVLKAAVSGKLVNGNSGVSEGELPEGWRWATVGEMTQKMQYGTSEKANLDETRIPVLRMGNIQDGGIDYSDLKYLPANTKGIDGLLLEPEDLLFNRTNSAELVGKTAVYKENHPKATFASYLIRVRLNPDVLSDFVSYYINSAFGRNYIKSVVSQQVGQANVNGTKLSNMPIPLPPLDEQQRIVAEVERRLSVVGEIASAVEAGLVRAGRLRQAVLRSAFEGRL